MTDERYREIVWILYWRQGQRCVCGEPFLVERHEEEIIFKELVEVAHRIPNTPRMRRKYGDEVIDHPDNMALVKKHGNVAGHGCNDSVLIGDARPREQERLAESIRSEG